MNMTKQSQQHVPGLIRGHAVATPNQVAMRHKRYGLWREFTWSEVAANVENLAAWLLDEVGESECVAILGNNEPELFWAEYAINSAGRAAVCLFPELEPAELKHIVDETSPRILFVEDQEQCDKVLDILVGTSVERIVYWDDRGLTKYDDPRLMSFTRCLEAGTEALERDPGRVERSVDAIEVDDLAVVIYTSGTTSMPKGTRSSHRFLIDCALRWAEILGVEEHRNYISYISPAWATEQYLGITLGALAPLVVNFPESPMTTTRDSREIGAEYLFFSPRQWESIVTSIDLRMRDASWVARRLVTWALRARSADPGGGVGARIARTIAWHTVCRPLRDRMGLSRLRAGVNSGGALGEELFLALSALGIRMHNAYGFTEVGIITATTDTSRFETLGTLLSSTLGDSPLELRIQDNEVQVRGGVPFTGYYLDKPDESRLTDDGWIRSGDSGYLTADGHLVYLDRLDNISITDSGEVVAPQFVETRLRLSPYVQQVVVVPARDGYLHALVEPDEEAVRSWAEEKRLTVGSFQQLSQQPEVVDLIAQEIEKVNRLAPTHTRVSKFANLIKKLDPDDGELTRSGKVRKTVVIDRYQDIIEALGGDLPEVDATARVRYANGKESIVRGRVTIMKMNVETEKVLSASALSSRGES
jgi:long-chain acyl-CoA synthetase